MSMQEPPEEFKRRAPHDPRLYIRNYWVHPNDPSRPYDFHDTEGEEHLKYMTDDDGHLNPQNWGDVVVLLFARGCLKTTSCVAIANWALDMYPNIEGTVTAPRQDQTGEVIDKFKERARESGLADRRVRDKISHQKFETETDTQTVTADLKSRSAWQGGDALRGIHSHFGIIDEFQDVDEEMFSTFLEAVDQGVPDVPYFPTIFVIGTPKMANTFFHRLWGLSDQKTWDADEEEWIAQAEAERYSPSDSGSSDGFHVTGWHVDQPNCPLHDGDDVAFKEAEYTEKKFQNEVLAQFYTPENDLLSDVHVHNILVEDMEFQRRRQFADSTVSLGVDWGGGDDAEGSDTVIVVGETYETSVGEPHTDILSLDFLSRDLTKQEELREVEDTIRQYDADVCVVDEGYGAKQREDLQDGNNTIDPDGHDCVFGCHYGSPKDKESLVWKSDDKRQFTCNRTHMMEWLVDHVKNEKISIPRDMNFSGRKSEGQRLISQLTAPYTHARETSSGKRKLTVSADRNDDAFHALTYAWIGAHKIAGTRRTLTTIRTHQHKGI